VPQQSLPPDAAAAAAADVMVVVVVVHQPRRPLIFAQNAVVSQHIPIVI
jgi:hypothetical protein